MEHKRKHPAGGGAFVLAYSIVFIPPIGRTISFPDFRASPFFVVRSFGPFVAHSGFVQAKELVSSEGAGSVFFVSAAAVFVHSGFSKCNFLLSFPVIVFLIFVTGAAKLPSVFIFEAFPVARSLGPLFAPENYASVSIRYDDFLIFSRYCCLATIFSTYMMAFPIHTFSVHLHPCRLRLEN